MRKAYLAALLSVTACGGSPATENAAVDNGAETAASATPAAVAPTELAASTEEGTPYSAPADPRASYLLLSVTGGHGRNIIAMTRRSGPSGVSYSRREIDCGAQLTRYVGEGDTLEEAMRPAPNPGDMAELVEGSSTWAAVQAACAKR